MTTKLCPHLLGGSHWSCEWVRRGAPAVKLANDFGFASEAFSLPHRPLILGRVVLGNELDPNAMLQHDPTLTAMDYVARYLETHIRLNPAVTHWEGPNECVVTTPEAMRWYAQFLAEFARAMRSLGKTAVVGGWAVGNPDYPLWAYYGEALAAVRRYGAVLSRHSYAGPDRSTWGYTLLRHREDNRYFTAQGYPDLPLLLTEFGADDVPFGNPQGKAWRKLYGDDHNAYLTQILLPADAELQKDAYVKAAFVFTGGGGWLDHNIEPEPARSLAELTHLSQPPSPAPPPSDGATHVVTPSMLNVRSHPWTGDAVPERVRGLTRGDRVRVWGEYKGWGSITDDSNEWVSLRYLKAL